MKSSIEQKQYSIPFGEPYFGNEESDALRRVVGTTWVLNGPEVRHFEKDMAQYVGANGSEAVQSCTAGMHLALQSLGLKPGDEVLMPTFNFVAAGIAALQCGYKPRFVDVKLDTGNVDPAELKKKLTPKTKAILALHYAGSPCDLESINAFAKEHSLKVVEDAAHALGASYHGKKIGSHSDATVFSFGPLKMICTGMGGIVTSPHDEVLSSIRALRSYGMDKSNWDRKEDPKPWNYAVGQLGHNFRMTDFQACMGIEQLKKLDQFIKCRSDLAKRYNERLQGLNEVRFLQHEKNAQPVVLYYVIRIKREGDLDLRNRLGAYLIGKGIGVSVHWDPPLHLHPHYRSLGYKKGDFPKTEMLSNEILSLPMFSQMTESDVDSVCNEIIQFFKDER